MILTRDGIRRIFSDSETTTNSGTTGGSGGGGGGGSADYAAEAGHAAEADHATNADYATEAGTAEEAGHATSAENLDVNSTDWTKILRKDVADTAAEVITFAKGLVSTLVSKFKAGLKIGANDEYGIDVNGDATLRDISGRNISASGTLGVTGKTTLNGGLDVTGDVDVTDSVTIGGTLDVTGKLTGVDAEFQNLEITKEAHFKKLVVDEMLSNKGAIIISSANCVAEIVETVSGGYGVFFGTKDANGNSVTNSWRVGDQALCLTFNGEGAGTFSDVRNRYYWRKVTQVLSNTTYGTGTYHYIKLSNVRGEYDGSTTPAAGDNIVQLGYRGTDADYRQSAVILSSYPTMDSGVKPPSLAFYKGISTFSLISNRYTYIDGLSNEFIGNFKILVNGSYTNLTTVLATLEGIIMGVKSIVRGKNILQVDGWTDGSGNLLGATNYTEATQKFTNDDGSGVASDILYSPVFFLKAGTYTYSHYSSNDEVELYVYQDSGNFVINNPPESYSYPVTLTRSGDTYQGVLRRYCTFTLNSDSYVCLNLYHDSFVFDAYRPMLEEGDSCSNWETGTVDHTTQIKILSNAINLSIRAGLLTTGIDITNGTVKLIADKVNFYDSAGQNLNSLIWIDPTTGTLHAVDAVLTGSLLSHKVVQEANYNYLALANASSTVHTSMKADIFVITRNYSIFTISFPPAYLFPGVSVRIVVSTTSTITYEMTISRLSGEQAEYTDVQNEVYNGFANMLTGTNWGMSSLQFSTSQYKMLELVSAVHPVHTSYYCWMLVDAR